MAFEQLFFELVKNGVSRAVEVGMSSSEITSRSFLIR